MRKKSFRLEVVGTTRSGLAANSHQSSQSAHEWLYTMLYAALISHATACITNIRRWHAHGEPPEPVAIACSTHSVFGALPGKQDSQRIRLVCDEETETAKDELAWELELLLARPQLRSCSLRPQRQIKPRETPDVACINWPSPRNTPKQTFKSANEHIARCSWQIGA
jgi:hypothetical protein